MTANRNNAKANHPSTKGPAKAEPAAPAEPTAPVATILTPKEVAPLLGTDPKTLRKFLRSVSAERPGRQGRWAINAADVPTLKERFATWERVTTTLLVLADEEADTTES